VQAVASQSISDHCTGAEAKAAFVARLQALGRANRHILKSDWSGVALHTLVESELEPFRTNVTIEGIPVTLRPQDAQNLTGTCWRGWRWFL
jgi:two-component sensor histidine kinase